MAYRATIIPVMIASPGDVSEEREIVREVIHDWNDVNAAASKVVLTPVGWETHSSPELGVRPQELINSRLLKNCDLLIGVFWTRLGTPTGKAESGTVEEIKEHVSSGKPAMIYFSSKPVAPQSIDPDQYSAVQNFTSECRELGLVEEFDDVNDFRLKLNKQIQLCLAHNDYLKKVIGETPDNPLMEESAAESTRIEYQISEEAKILIKAAAQRDDGTILRIETLGGRTIQAGGQAFGGKRGKEAAKWENALNELEQSGLVVARGYKGEVFELTYQGWELAEKL